MKTLAIATFLAAPVALVLSPINFESVVSIVFGAGLAAIVFTDYARPFRPLRSSVTPADVSAGRRERFGLAA